MVLPQKRIRQNTCFRFNRRQGKSNQSVQANESGQMKQGGAYTPPFLLFKAIKAFYVILPFKPFHGLNMPFLTVYGVFGSIVYSTMPPIKFSFLHSPDAPQITGVYDYISAQPHIRNLFTQMRPCYPDIYRSVTG